MVSSLVFILAIALAMAVGFYVHARVKYHNLLAGQPFRDWIVDRAPQIVRDESANQITRFAAITMLECVYDSAKMLRIQQFGKNSTGPAQLNSELFEANASFVSEGIKHLSALSVLNDAVKGAAFRIMVLQDADHPLLAVTGIMENNSPFKKNIGSSRAEMTEKAVEGVNLLPVGRLYAERLERSLAYECPA